MTKIPISWDGKEPMDTDKGIGWIGKILFFGGILLLFLAMLNPIVIIGAGSRGVKFSAVSGVDLIPKNEGITLRIPVIESYTIYSVQKQKIETKVDAATQDLQTLTTVVALNYHLLPEQVAYLHKEIGIGYGGIIITPAIEESVKASTAKFTAEEVITKREEVKLMIKSALTERLRKYNIDVDEFNIVDFDFSEEFNKAIEAKQVAAQNALRAQRELDQAKFDQEKKVVQAKAEADALNLTASARANARLIEATAEAQALKMVKEQLNGDMLQKVMLDKWDGKLPLMSGQAIPMVNLMTSAGVINATG